MGSLTGVDPLPRAIRLRRAGVLGLGAVAYALLVGGPLDFVWTPFVLGVVYLVAAAAGGPEGGLWATACVLLGWGLGVLLWSQTDVEVERSAAEVFGVGLGVTAAAVLARRGFASEFTGAGATVLFAGAVFLFGRSVDVVTEWWPYALLLALVAAFNLAQARGG